MKRVRLRSWTIRLLACLIILLMLLITIDRWQGGALGRKNYGSATEGIRTVVGNRIWFGGDMLVNTTHLPITILSVRPANTPPGLLIKTGIMMNTSAGGVIILNKENTKNYTFLHNPIKIPTGEDNNLDKRYFTALEVVPRQSGTYRINGLIVRYRWGLFTYTVKLASPTFVISVRKS